MMSLEEPSMSLNEGLGLVIIGKKIQPVEIAQEG